MLRKIKHQTLKGQRCEQATHKTNGKSGKKIFLKNINLLMQGERANLAVMCSIVHIENGANHSGE